MLHDLTDIVKHSQVPRKKGQVEHAVMQQSAEAMKVHSGLPGCGMGSGPSNDDSGRPMLLRENGACTKHQARSLLRDVAKLSSKSPILKLQIQAQPRGCYDCLAWCSRKWTTNVQHSCHPLQVLQILRVEGICRSSMASPTCIFDCLMRGLPQQLQASDTWMPLVCCS